MSSHLLAPLPLPPLLPALRGGPLAAQLITTAGTSVLCAPPSPAPSPVVSMDVGPTQTRGGDVRLPAQGPPQHRAGGQMRSLPQGPCRPAGGTICLVLCPWQPAGPSSRSFHRGRSHPGPSLTPVAPLLDWPNPEPRAMRLVALPRPQGSGSGGGGGGRRVETKAQEPSVDDAKQDLDTLPPRGASGPTRITGWTAGGVNGAGILSFPGSAL